MSEALQFGQHPDADQISAFVEQALPAHEREQMLGHMARKHGLPLVIVGQVGGNDDLIFDGHSATFDAEGRMFARARGYVSDTCRPPNPTGVVAVPQ